MTISKSIVAVVLAVALVALPASAQVSPTQEADSETAALQELVASQETLIMEQQELIVQQQELINEQEALLTTFRRLINIYRCMFDVDTEVVPGGCPETAPRERTPEEAADAAIVYQAWLAEAPRVARARTAWRGAALILQNGEATNDSPAILRLIDTVSAEFNQTTAIIPLLQSEWLIELFTIMAAAIQDISDTHAADPPTEEMARVILESLDRLDNLEEGIGELCP